MRHLDRLFGAALLALVPALPARADPAPPPAATASPPPLTVTRPDADPRMERRMARRAAMMAADLDAVRAGLQLTAAQDKLWPPVADAMRGLDEARGFRFRQTLAAAATPIDGLRLQGDHMARMGAAMGRLADATKPFVASLTPDQKSRLPALVQTMRPRKIVSRAFDLPQDTGGGSWGVGQQGQAGGSSWGIGPQGQAGGGMGRGGGMGQGGQQGMGGPGMRGPGMGGPQGMAAPAGPPAASGGMDQDRDDDE